MRSGLGAQIGVATEDEYGTFKTPSRYLPFENESLELEQNFNESAGLRAGRLAQASNLHSQTTRTVSGDFAMEFLDQGMGVILNQLHGNEVTPAKQEVKSEEVFKQIHEIGLTDPFGKSMTVQVGRPDTADTTHAFNYIGCKVIEFKLAIESGGTAMMTVSLDGKDEDLEEELGEATYDADALPYTFQQMAVKIGGETAANIRSIELTVAIGSNTERYHLGNQGTKDEPIVNELLAVTYDATLEFASIADHNRYKNQNQVALALEGTGAEIGEEGETFAANFDSPAVKQVSSSPTVDGPDVITQDVTFKALDNGSEAPLEVELLSTDSAL